jgi:predicted RNA-binding protein (virulence factor B family)
VQCSRALPVDDILGRSVTLPLVRIGSPGAYLAIDPGDTRPDAPGVLLLGPEIPEGAKIGDALDVFVALDSEGRPIATVRTPKVERDEVAFLRVTATTQFGAFVDWGLAKELLVPFAEQTTPMLVDERYAVGVYVDQTGRLAGTMRIAEMLDGEHRPLELDEWVEGEAWRNDPAIGLFVILERSFVGLVPASEPHSASRGDAVRCRVTNILADKKVELSLRGYAHEELETDAQRILDVINHPNAPRIGDRSSPDELRATFGLSKKAFKRALGRLLKQGAVVVDRDGFVAPKKR